MKENLRSLFRPKLACVLVLLASSQFCRADPMLSNLFSDHMVLLRDRSIHVWGKADVGEAIKVSLAGHTATTNADPRGDWSLELPALPAGGPFTITVQGKKEIQIRDVMIGEVWIASGQSNMTFSLDGSANAATEVPKADYSQIRLFTVPRRIALEPQNDTRPAHWEICTPDTAKSFSAVAYFFAREIYDRLKVPVGVVESAWPGTAIEYWISPESLRADSELSQLTSEWEHAKPEEKTFARDSLPVDLEFDDFELIPAVANAPNRALASFDDGSSLLTTGGSFSYSWADAPDTTFDLLSPGRGGAGMAVRIEGKLDGTRDAILSARYQVDGSPADLSAYSGIRFWVRGNGAFRFRSKQPTITDYDDYAVPVQKAAAAWQPITILFHDLKQDGWGVMKDFTPASLTGFSIECLTSVAYPPIPVSSLYEGMITPLLPYQFRGALWYQGESNGWRPHQYRKLLPTMIENWRAAFHQNDLDFLIVQLPNHGAIPTEPGESGWAELREAELMTVQHTPHTGLAVTIDVGDPKDLHPHRKMEVGQRLALWALGTTYHQPIEYSGPLYESFQVQGSEIHIHFSHASAGLEARGGATVDGFAIAGADHKFHWAQARIEGDKVIVSSPDVPSPVAVRYAWGDSPNCNLFNREGLPASPFRTDDWPGIRASMK